MKSILVSTPDQMVALGLHCAQFLESKSVCYLHGELGSGKTTWTKGVLNGLGYKGIVQSPTYSILNEYTADNRCIMHFDLYRLSGSDDFLDSGLSDEIERGDVSLIEWPLNCALCLPPPTAELYFEQDEDGSRHFVSVDEKQYTEWKLDLFEQA